LHANKPLGRIAEQFTVFVQGDTIMLAKDVVRRSLIDFLTAYKIPFKVL